MCLRSQIEMAKMNKVPSIRDKHIRIAREACSAYATRIPEVIMAILIAIAGVSAILLQSESDINDCIEALDDYLLSHSLYAEKGGLRME